jgi:Mannosyltransferase putative
VQGKFLYGPASRCEFFGPAIDGRTSPCRCNPAKVQLQVFACERFGACTPTNQAVEPLQCCATCTSRKVEFLPGHADPIPVPALVTPPSGWSAKPATIQQHRAALDQVLAMRFTAPPNLDGDGIIFVSDAKFHFQAALAIAVTRNFTDLPIQWWYHTDRPQLDLIPEFLQGVTLHDMEALQPRPRIIGGWPMKLVAILNSGFRRALYLDADAYLVDGPGMLFDVAAKTTFVYWQDLDACEANVPWRRLLLDEQRGRKVPQVQGGHYCVDVAAAYRMMAVAYWMDQHSDFFYRHVYADQDLLRIAIGLTEQPYHVPDIARWRPRAFVVGFPHIKPIIVHRCQGKLFPYLGRNQKAAWLPQEDLVWNLFERIKTRMKTTEQGRGTSIVRPR